MPASLTDVRRRGGGWSARGKSRGLTLIELIVTMLIVVILTMVAIPSFINTIQGNRLATQMNELQGDLNLARSEAIKRGQQVKVCRGLAANCWSGCWKDGWTVFVAVDTNTNSLTSKDVVISRHGPLAGAPKVVDTAGFLTYGSNGVAYTGDTGSVYRTYQGNRIEMYETTCNSADVGGSLQRLTISATGYIHLCKKNDSSTNCGAACLTSWASPGC